MLTRLEKRMYDEFIKHYKRFREQTRFQVTTHVRVFMEYFIDNPNIFQHALFLQKKDYETKNYIKNLPIFHMRFTETSASLYLIMGEELKPFTQRTLRNKVNNTPYYLLIESEEFLMNPIYNEYIKEDKVCEEAINYASGYINFLELQNESTEIQKEIDNLLLQPKLTPPILSNLTTKQLRLAEIKSLNIVNQKTYLTRGN